jgi:hypothetical protein
MTQVEGGSREVVGERREDLIDLAQLWRIAVRLLLFTSHDSAFDTPW